MAHRLNARRARAIRIGINARLPPYVTGGNGDDGYYAALDFVRMWKYLTDWEFSGKRNPLSRRAYERTTPRTSQHREEAAK